MLAARRPLVVVAVLGFVVLTASASAQQGGVSAIAGIVRDPSGAVLPGATVQATSPVLIERVREVVTDEQGQYKIVNLPPGTYSVTVSLPGFKSVQRAGIELTTNFTAPVNAQLEVGSVEETLTVSGTAPVVDVQNAATRNIISARVLDTIPTGKTMLTIIALTPGMAGNTAGQDVGGSKGDLMPFFSFHGSAQGDSKLEVNGFNVNNAAASGRGFVPSPQNTQEIAVELGGGSAEQPSGGIQFNYISKAGGNLFRGDLTGSFTNQKLQSNNFNDTLASRGMTASTINRLDKVGDIGFGFGGAVVQDKLWYFGSYRYWAAGTYVAGQYFNKLQNSLLYQPDLSRPVINDFWGNNASLRMTWQATARNQFSFHYEWEKRCDCTHLMGNNAIFQGLSAGEATDHQIFLPVDILQMEWTSPVSNKLLFNGGIQFSRPTWSTFPQPGLWPGAVAITEDTTGQRWGAEPGINSYLTPSTRHKMEPRLSMTYVTGSHAFKTGFNLTHEWGQLQTTIVPNDVNYTFHLGLPVTITQFGTPLTVLDNMKADLGVYGQDQWTHKRLTLNAGLRFDYIKDDVPAQHLPPTRFRLNAVDTPALDCSPCQSDFSPRVSVAYDLFGTGKTALKFAAGRYMLARGNSGVYNPANFVVTNASRQWNDANGNFVPDCDLTVITANGECAALNNNRFGTINVTTAIADNARLDYRRNNVQFSGGVQHQVLPGTSVNVSYYRTTWNQFTVTDNLLTTPADYNSYCVPLPSDGQLPGGGGNQLCGLYAVSAAKFGQSQGLVARTSDYGGEQTDVFDGVDVILNARLPRGGFLTGGTSTGREVFDNCFAAQQPDLTATAFTNPSVAAPTLANNPSGFCRVSPPFLTQLKLQGSYPLAWDFQISAAYQNTPGIPIHASLVVPNPTVAESLGRPLPGNASSVTIANIIAPLTVYEDRISQLDLRLTRIFRLGGARRFQANLDVYNALNGSSILNENTNYGPNWKRPTLILDGRLVKFGGQLSF
jgi:hypothetical protein